MNSRVSIGTLKDENSMPTAASVQKIARVQEKPNRSLHQTQNTVDIDELQVLQNEANEALNKIETAKPVPDYDSSPLFDSGVQVAAIYRDAVDRNDRPALRQMVSAEMSITQDSEEALLRGTASASTQLQIDKQGGSYLLIHKDNKNWLVPTFFMLKYFTTIQPDKGIFVYERDNVLSAVLRRPAEVREDRGVWEVVNMGVVAVPIKA